MKDSIMKIGGKKVPNIKRKLTRQIVEETLQENQQLYDSLVPSSSNNHKQLLKNKERYVLLCKMMLIERKDKRGSQHRPIDKGSSLQSK